MTDPEIAELISMPKRITEPPSKTWKEEGAQRRKDFWLEPTGEASGKFRAFARQNTLFPENFSIGLEYEPQDGKDCIILLRCNGPHGDYNGTTNPEHPHFHPHIHRATERAINKGERAEKYADRSDQFSTVQQAMRYFLDTIGVNEEDQTFFFQEDLRRTLFDGLEDTP